MEDSVMVEGPGMGIFLAALMLLTLSLLVSSLSLLIHRNSLDLKFRTVIVPVLLYGIFGFFVYILFIWGLEIAGILEPWYFEALAKGTIHPLWFSPFVVLTFMIYAACKSVGKDHKRF